MGCCQSKQKATSHRTGSEQSNNDIVIEPLDEAEAAALTSSAHIRLLLRNGLTAADLTAERYELMYASNGGHAHGFVRDANPGGPDADGQWRFKRGDGAAPIYGRGAGACVAAIGIGIVGDEATRKKVAEFDPEPGRKLGLGTIYGSDRFTLVHYACVEDEPELVALLLRNGGSLVSQAGSRGKRGIAARSGVTAMGVACGNGNRGVEDAIVAHMIAMREEKKN